MEKEKIFLEAAKKSSERNTSIIASHAELMAILEKRFSGTDVNPDKAKD